jgi:hypothetical protein
MSVRFQVVFPPYAHQDINGVIVIVNVETGVYLSLRDTGAAIFNRLADGAAAGEISAELAARHSDGDGEIAAHVERLVGELASEGVIAPADGLTPAPAPVFDGEPTPFVAPVLERFTDMKDLLLLDPIHEVADAGWPIIKTPGG